MKTQDKHMGRLPNKIVRNDLNMLKKHQLKLKTGNIVTQNVEVLATRS